MESKFHMQVIKTLRMVSQNTHMLHGFFNIRVHHTQSTCRISFGMIGKDLTCHCEVSRSIASFIAKGPNNDGRLILVTLHHSYAPVYDAMKPQRIVGRHDCIVVQRGVKAMGLIICLIQEVDAILIT